MQQSVHNLLRSLQSALRPHGRVCHNERGTTILAYLLQASLSADLTDSTTNSSIRKHKEYWGSIKKHNTRSNHVGESQTVETRETSTLVDAASTPKLGKTRYHLPANENNTGNSRRKIPVHGTQHGKNSRPFHSGEYVNFIKHYNTDHRHPESTTKLDIISTSTSRYCGSNCWGMHIKKTNHMTA